MSLLHLIGTSANVAPQVYIDDVFSAYMYTGNATVRSIVNGIDLATKGGMVQAKVRQSAGYAHVFYDTVRGATKDIQLPAAGQTTDVLSLTSFNSNGFSLGVDTSATLVNGNNASMISWSYAVSPNFFYVGTKTVAGSNQTVDLSSLGTVGMVSVRNISSGADVTYHRSCTSGKLVNMGTNAAEATSGAITLSGTTLTLVQSVLGNGSYVIYAWAHNTASTGLIQCGTFTTDGSGNASVTLGWEPQHGLIKRVDSAGSWFEADVVRAMPAKQSRASVLSTDTTDAEVTSNIQGIQPNATGFTFELGSASRTYIYRVIRRNTKPPTSGAQVYAAIASTGTGAAATITGGIAADVILSVDRNQLGGNSTKARLHSRLRSATQNLAFYGSGEASRTDGLLTFTNDGMTLGVDAVGFINYASDTYIHHLLRRFPGVLEEINYSGTGANKTETHNLGVAPELWIVKGKSGSTDALVGCTALANTEYLAWTTAAKASGATVWNSTYPTASLLSVGAHASVNTNLATYNALLFATMAGISKVGSYTGNGSSQTINCGFSAGARLVLIKRTDSTGDWYLWDSVRGIVSGNDPHLSLNTFVAEVTGDDSLDPDSSGFIVNEIAATHINVNAATYIFLAIA